MADLLNVLVEARSGGIIRDLNEKFNRVLTGVLETAGKGELVVKFSIEPAKQGFGGAVIEVDVTHDVKMKVPELKVGSAKFYVTKDGNLSRNDPAQEEMFVGSEAPEAKKSGIQ